MTTGRLCEETALLEQARQSDFCQRQLFKAQFWPVVCTGHECHPSVQQPAVVV